MLMTHGVNKKSIEKVIPLNAELTLICHLLPLLGPHHIFRVRGVRVKLSFSNDKNNGKFTRIAAYIYDRISLNSSYSEKYFTQNLYKQHTFYTQ